MLPWAGLHAQQATNKTTSFRVAATVVEFCNVTTPDLASRNRTLQLRAICTPNTTYQFGLNSATGVGTGRAVDHTVFGGVPASRVVPAGDFADTITLHIYY